VSSCAICPRAAPDGQHLCLLHAGELRGWLAELPHQAALLQEFVAAAGRPAEGRLGGTGRADAPVPVDLRVLVLLGPGRFDAVPGTDDDENDGAPIAATLGAWAGHIAYHYPAATRDPYGVARTQPCEQARPTRGETIAGWCTWLTAYLPYALTLPIAADLHRGLGDLVHHIRRLTHATPRRHPQGAPCPACDAFALVRTDGQWEIMCSFCGHQMEPEAYDQHAAAFLHAHQTADDAPATSLDKDPYVA
jgi:Zn ribbon nucleic-acid-binding protein